MKSVWSESVNQSEHKSLNGSLSTDVLIIGGGMAGVLCGYFLKQMGVNYTLVEAKKIGDGVTKNTTAKITAQHGLIYDKLINSVGIQYAKQYLDINLWAVQKYKELCKSIDCDFEEKNSYVYSLTDYEMIEKEVVALSKLGIKSDIVKQINPPINIEAAIMLPLQAQFNPMKFITHIANGLNIYENTFVESIKGNIATTNNGNITAKKIIITTHFPFLNRAGLYFAKMYQHRSYVIALENAEDVNGMYVDEAENGMSFRNYQGLLLIGGADHKTGDEGNGFETLRAFAKANYPSATEKYSWATQDCMSLDGVPYIGRYSNLLPDVFVATGFNKWGMTSSMVSASILTDMVTGTQNKYTEVFSPQRSILKPQLFVNLGHTATNFFSFRTKRCSHLGCALIWNKYEKTWDCPCHGSRYSQEGKVIDNPAMKDIFD